ERPRCASWNTACDHHQAQRRDGARARRSRPAKATGGGGLRGGAAQLARGVRGLHQAGYRALARSGREDQHAHEMNIGGTRGLLLRSAGMAECIQRAFESALVSRSDQQEMGMASIEKFNDHCWKDVIPAADLELYANWRRETFVGPRPALLAIDLYDIVYRGGPRPPIEINEQYPNTCGIFAHPAIEPTNRLSPA